MHSWNRFTKFSVLSLIALTTVVAADGTTDSSVLKKTEVQTYHATFPAKNGKDTDLLVERQFRFFFPNSKILPETQELAKTDASSLIEHRPDGDYKIDCRDVAKDMVLALIKHRMKSVKNLKSNDFETHTYIERADPLQLALAAQQFDLVTVNVGEPQFVCKEAAIERQDGSKEVGKCAQLFIWAKPQASPVTGKNEITYRPEACDKYVREEAMSAETCELLVLTEGCGLRYVQKAHAGNEKNSATWGLSDLIESNIRESMKRLNVLRPNKDGSTQTTILLPAARSGAERVESGSGNKTQ